MFILLMLVIDELIKVWVLHWLHGGLLRRLHSDLLVLDIVRTWTKDASASEGYLTAEAM